jgi:hypothetical protein
MIGFGVSKRAGHAQNPPNYLQKPLFCERVDFHTSQNSDFCEFSRGVGYWALITQYRASWVGGVSTSCNKNIS